MLSPLYWAIITAVLTHALGTKRGIAAVAVLHQFINGLADAPG